MNARQILRTSSGLCIILLAVKSLDSTKAFAESPSSTTFATETLTPLNMPPTFSNGYFAVFSQGGIDVYGPEHHAQVLHTTSD